MADGGGAATTATTPEETAVRFLLTSVVSASFSLETLIRCLRADREEEVSPTDSRPLLSAFVKRIRFQLHPDKGNVNDGALFVEFSSVHQSVLRAMGKKSLLARLEHERARTFAPEKRTAEQRAFARLLGSHFDMLARVTCEPPAPLLPARIEPIPPPRWRPRPGRVYKRPVGKRARAWVPDVQSIDPFLHKTEMAKPESTHADAEVRIAKRARRL